MPRPVRDSNLNAQTPPQPMPMNLTWVEGCTAHQASKDIKLPAAYVNKRQKMTASDVASEIKLEDLLGERNALFQPMLFQDSCAHP